MNKLVDYIKTLKSESLVVTIKNRVVIIVLADDTILRKDIEFTGDADTIRNINTVDTVIDSRRNKLEEYQMVNSWAGEELPIIDESLYHQMKGKDKITYDALPDNIIVYRGASLSEITGEYIGQSWTTSIEDAEYFAYIRYESPSRCVLKATIAKSNIYAYVDERNEKECIVNTKELRDIGIYSTETLGGKTWVKRPERQESNI